MGTCPANFKTMKVSLYVLKCLLDLNGERGSGANRAGKIWYGFRHTRCPGVVLFLTGVFVDVTVF